MTFEKPDWFYPELISSYLNSIIILLDIGTDDTKLFQSFKHP